MNIRYQLSTAFGCISFFVVTVLGFSTYSASRALLEASILRDKSEEAQRIISSIQYRLDKAAADLKFLSDSPNIQGLVRAWQNQGVDPLDGSTSSHYTNRLATTLLAMLRNRPEYTQIRCIDAAGQELLRCDTQGGAARISANDQLQNAAAAPFFMESMALAPGAIYVSPLELQRENGKILFPHHGIVQFAMPVFNPAGERKALLAIHLQARHLLERVKTTQGNVYVANQNGFFLHHPDPAKTFGFELGHSHGLEQTHPGLFKAMASTTEASNLHPGDAAAGIPPRVEGFAKIHYAPQDSSRYWAVVFDLPAEIAFAPLATLRNIFGGVGLIILILASLAGFIWSKQFAKPMVDLVRLAEQITRGDLTVEVPETRRKDEIGVLAGRFKEMLAGLRIINRELHQTVHALSSSASEIQAAASQVATGAADTATSVTESTATIAEVKQTSRLSSDKANLLAENAKKSSQTAQAGQQAVEDSIQGMHRVQEQARLIADTVVKLSEQSQAIGEIVATVADLAEQSNLLAVNAAIEAARAGDQGKGFAVVAQEIHSLADQSKQATVQVRSILNEIQKAIGTAVMATDQGSKTVEAGVEQAAQAGEAIRDLAEIIESGSQAALQIAVSSQQQLTGMDQVATAIQNIESAATQNVAGCRQFEASARQLNQIGQKLKELVERYQV